MRGMNIGSPIGSPIFFTLKIIQTNYVLRKIFEGFFFEPLFMANNHKAHRNNFYRTKTYTQTLERAIASRA